MQEPQAPSRVDSVPEMLNCLEMEREFGAENVARGLGFLSGHETQPLPSPAKATTAFLVLAKDWVGGGLSGF